MSDLVSENGKGSNKKPSPLEYLEQSFFEIDFRQSDWKKINTKKLKNIEALVNEIEEVDEVIRELEETGGDRELIVELKRGTREKRRELEEKKAELNQRTGEVQEQLDLLKVSIQRYVNPPNASHLREVYVGITSGPDVYDALKGRYDKKKKGWKITRMICISVIKCDTGRKVSDKVKATMREVNKLYESALITEAFEAANRPSLTTMVHNTGSGGEGRKSMQDKHYTYIAIAERR